MLLGAGRTASGGWWWPGGFGARAGRWGVASVPQRPVSGSPAVSGSPTRPGVRVWRRHRRRSRYGGAMPYTMRQPALGVPAPSLEIVLGTLAWTVGAAGLASGFGTVLVALGLFLTAYLWFVRRRTRAMAVMLHPERKRRMQRLVLVGVAGIVLLPSVLALVGYGELATAVSAALVGVLLIMASTVLEERSLVAVGGVVLVIAALGAFLALNSAGTGGSQPVIGLGAGLVLWVAAMRRLGVLDELGRRYNLRLPGLR